VSADDLPKDDLLDDPLPAECSWLLEARVPEERPDDEWPPRATAESDERKTHAATKTERVGFFTSPCITENRRDGNRNDSRFTVGFVTFQTNELRIAAASLCPVQCAPAEPGKTR
jgi:hypothetical protein